MGCHDSFPSYIDHELGNDRLPTLPEPPVVPKSLSPAPRRTPSPHPATPPPPHPAGPVPHIHAGPVPTSMLDRGLRSVRAGHPGWARNAATNPRQGNSSLSTSETHTLVARISPDAHATPSPTSPAPAPFSAKRRCQPSPSAVPSPPLNPHVRARPRRNSPQEANHLGESSASVPIVTTCASTAQLASTAS